MNREYTKYTEILFALYMNGGQAAMSWLGDLLSAGEEPDTRRSVGRLVSAGLVRLFLEDRQVSVALTQEGEQAALAAAGYLSEKLVDRWQSAGREGIGKGRAA